VPIESITAAAETKDDGGITEGGVGGITGLLSFPHDNWVIIIKDVMSVTKTFLIKNIILVLLHL
jgi:hypothetical protein